MSISPASPSAVPVARHGLRRLVPGVLLALAIGAAALALTQLAWFQHAQVSALTLAIVIGMVIGNTVGTRLPASIAPGIVTAQRTLLRLGVMLYGLRISFQQIAAIGPEGLLIDLVVVVGVIALASLLGRRVFGIDRQTSLLTGIGSAICGAAAVLALERVLKAEPDKVAIAIATVVLFGTLDIFLYPLLYPYLGMTTHQFGLFTGASVHEVAQVVAVGNAIDPTTADTAVIVKLTRVMLLVPVLFVFGWLETRGRVDGGGLRAAIPWFALGFVAVAAFNSLIAIPPAIRQGLLTFDVLVLATAMAALGLETRWAKLRALGPKPLLLAGVLWLCLIGAGAALVHALI